MFETDRLVVRRIRSDDLDNFAALCGDSLVARSIDDGRPLARALTLRARK
jgi:hypothetical protein